MDITPINSSAKNTQLNIIHADLVQLRQDIADGNVTSLSACARLRAIDAKVIGFDAALADKNDG